MPEKIQCDSIFPHRWRTFSTLRFQSFTLLESGKNQQLFCWTEPKTFSLHLVLLSCQPALETTSTARPFGSATPTAPLMWTCARCFPSPPPLPEANGWFDFWRATLRLTCGLSYDTRQGYTTLKYSTKLYVIVTCSWSEMTWRCFLLCFAKLKSHVFCTLQTLNNLLQRSWPSFAFHVSLATLQLYRITCGFTRTAKV